MKTHSTKLHLNNKMNYMCKTMLWDLQVFQILNVVAMVSIWGVGLSFTAGLEKCYLRHWEFLPSHHWNKAWWPDRFCFLHVRRAGRKSPFDWSGYGSIQLHRGLGSYLSEQTKLPSPRGKSRHDEHWCNRDLIEATCFLWFRGAE